MLKEKKLLIIGMSVLLSSAACQTVDKNVAQLVHQRKQAPRKINPHKDTFAKNIQGVYTLSDNTQLIINTSGHFQLDNADYFLFDAISDEKGVYVAATPSSDGSKKIYTYHGIIRSGNQLLNTPYKEPSFANKQVLTEKDTEYYWEVNVFQPENINWESAFTPVFATKNN